MEFANPYEPHKNAVGDLDPDLVKQANEILAENSTREAGAVKDDLSSKFVYLEPRQGAPRCP